MNIDNDIVTFKDTDILAFSPGMQAAIAAEIDVTIDVDGNEVPNKTPEQVLSELLNQRLTQIFQRYAARTLPSVAALQIALAKAAEPDKLAAQGFLDQAKVVLGVVVTDPVPTP